MGRPVVFVDRDGVLNDLVLDPETGQNESPLDKRSVRLVDEAAPAAARLREMGFSLACVTNQPAAAKGRLTLEELLGVHERVLQLLDEKGVQFDAVRMCLHHPDGVVADLTGVCACRKPAPGMLLDAGRDLDADLSRSWMIGDTDADVEAGQAAGCHTILVENPSSEHKRRGSVTPDHRVSSLSEATRFLD
jgi:D-glycero-D-manno-heptose 1,7-bisphosphate phosphatase